MATSCTPARVSTRLSLVRAVPACARVAATAPPLRPQRCKRFVSVSFRRIAFVSVPPQPKPPHPAARRPARATPGGNCRQGHSPPERRWLDCAGLWAIPRAGKRRAQAVSATRGRRGSLPYSTISRGARTARTIATACGCCRGPRRSPSSRRDASTVGHRQHGAGSYPLSTPRHPCDSTPPAGAHSTCTAIGHAPTVKMALFFLAAQGLGRMANKLTTPSPRSPWPREPVGEEADAKSYLTSLQRIFPEDFGERRTIYEGYVHSCSICSHYKIGL